MVGVRSQHTHESTSPIAHIAPPRAGDLDERSSPSAAGGVAATIVDDQGVRAASPCPRARRRVLAVCAALNALAAWAGALGLVAGGIDVGARINDRLPFDSPVLAGIALAVIVAIPLTALAWSAWTGADRTDDVALIAGTLIVVWAIVQLIVLPAVSLIQPASLCIGAAFIAASHQIALGTRARGALLLAVGAILVSIGVGLVPHLIKTGVTVTSVVSVTLLAIGIAVVVSGTRSLLQGRRRSRQVAGGVATAILLTVAVWVVAPAVAATHVPEAHVGSTPAALGLDYELVTLTTSDDVDLAAWYLPGANGAGVVMRHGAGSTRSDVLDQAAVLVGSGYGVLLIDARGHGDSDGTAMDFGWYGDLDIAAGTTFLASRADIDPTRIGVVGFSMGGEEAIGAAAADPLVSAVVAEGATGRRAADKEWYSNVYGWRGWLQERLETVQDVVTDSLTSASPPISLRDAVVDAPDTRFLLITAGNVDDEGHAASFIRSGGPARVTVWNVVGADHTGGFALQPDEWRHHVVEFLDHNLD